MLGACPFCGVLLPMNELEWHANNHFEDDNVAMDVDQQIAIAQSLSSRNSLESPYMTGQTCTTSFNFNIANYNKPSKHEIVYELVGQQSKSTFYKVEGDIMAMLKNCLEVDATPNQSVISGYIDHYESIHAVDSGWGCGWRNIQMLSSHLIMKRKEAKDVLFGGSGFVPDIPSLQKWLEIAWKNRFDVTGSNSFDQKVYGTKKWIGTTECAALLRYFGLRARIIDFDSLSGLDSRKKVVGPMDKFVHKKSNECEEKSSISASFCQKSGNSNKSKENTKGHQALVDWVWNYFTNQGSIKFSNIQNVLISEKTPLYFQHDGHSRTIVGIQKQRGIRGSQDRYYLLILDPAQRTADLENCLKTKRGWQQLIKRGVHTYRKPQYQLCYVDPGIAAGDELEQLKIIDSTYVKL